MRWGTSVNRRVRNYNKSIFAGGANLFTWAASPLSALELYPLVLLWSGPLHGSQRDDARRNILRLIRCLGRLVLVLVPLLVWIKYTYYASNIAGGGPVGRVR